ncbi:MAG: histidine kinase [Ferruginibacter sp.]|nr:histidine kinase [Cytophagales bacterium]
MSKSQIYWLCQLGGWSAFAFYETIGYYAKFGFQLSFLANGLVNLGLGIAVTHTYRLVIKRLQWLNLPLDQLVPRIVVSVLLLATLLTAVNLPLDFYIISDFSVKTDLLALVLMVTNWSKYLLLWSLIYHMFQYFERSKNTEVERMRLKSSVKEFEVKALRSQLNPHFVFNALNSIRALVLENPQKAQQGITQLSNILRNSLIADRRKTVMLSEELKTVEDYLALEKVRYEDRLKVEINVNADALDVQVPPLMVQTLVENAVKHGISKPLYGGFISINARLQKHFLYLDIKNTGTLQKLDSGGFGLINTSQRLELLYGAEASFKIKQDSDNVVCAQVKIPVQ